MQDLQGTFLEGVGTVGALLGATPDSAVYALDNEALDNEAAIKFRADTGAPDGDLSLDHPNLIRLRATGSCILDGVSLRYLVMERADETLAGVLAERRLPESDARELLDPTLAALGYLHRNGYAHTALRPSNVMACGDQLKLSSDRVVRAQSRTLQQEDIHALGELLSTALDAGVSDPYRRIIQRCLDPDPEKRWTIDRIEAELNLRPAAVPEPLPVATPAPEPPPPNRPATRTLALGAAAVVLLLGVIAAFRTGTHPAAPTPAAATISAPAPAPPKPLAASVTPEPTPSGNWAVVVATYGARTAAEKRAQSVTRKFPRFRAEVFEARAARTLHLVVIGRNLSEDEAAALRKRAIASGLPRATYVRRFPG